jgi:hypothetical protein
MCIANVAHNPLINITVKFLAQIFAPLDLGHHLIVEAMKPTDVIAWRETGDY